MEATIARSGFKDWRIQTPGATFLGDYLGDDLRTAQKILRDRGYTAVNIRHGGVQRPRYERRELA